MTGKAMKKRPVIMESYCVHHHRMLPIDNFYASTNPWHSDGVLPYCMDCCNEMVYYYLDLTGSLQSALWFTCAELSVPFIKEAYQAVENSAKSVDSKTKSQISNHTFKYFGRYAAALGQRRSKTENYDLFLKTDVDISDVKQLSKSEDALIAEAKKFELDWGKQSINDYEYLEYRYDIYTEGIPLTVAQDRLYRDLCLVELAKRKKDEAGEVTKDEQQQILKLMNTLKIDNFTDTSDKSVGEEMLEKQIAVHEQYEPMEYYEDKGLYKDIHGYEKDLEHIARATRNLIAGTREFPQVAKISGDDSNE